MHQPRVRRRSRGDDHPKRGCGIGLNILDVASFGACGGMKNVARMIGEHNLKFVVDGVLAPSWLAPCQWANEEKHNYHNLDYVTFIYSPITCQ